MAEEAVVPKSLTADEQAAIQVEQGAPLIAAFGALTDAQKISVLSRYVERFGAFPTPPAPPAEPETPPA